MACKFSALSCLFISQAEVQQEHLPKQSEDLEDYKVEKLTKTQVWAALPILLQRAESLKGSSVLELGAGCGLLVPWQERHQTYVSVHTWECAKMEGQ